MNLHLLVALIGTVLLPTISSVRYEFGDVLEVSRLKKSNQDLWDLEQLLAEETGANPTSELSPLELATRAALSFRDRDKYGINMFRAADKFSQLLDASTKCDADSYWLLRAAYLSAYEPRKTHQLTESSMIRRAVNEALERHGKVCRPNYMARFEKLLANPSFVKTKTKIDEIIPIETLDKIFSPGAGGIRQADVIGPTLSVLRKNWRSKARPSGLGFVMTGLQPPCEEYRQFVDDIFFPARIDLVLDDERIAEINPSEKFMEAWRQFRVCTVIEYEFMTIADKIG